MKRTVRTFLLVMSLLLSVSNQIFSQTNFSSKQALDLVNKNVSSLALSSEDLKNVIVTDAYEDRLAGTKMVYLQQTFKNIPVYNVIKVIAFKNDKVVSSAGDFVSKVLQKVNVPDATPSSNPGTAVAAAALSVDRPIGQIDAPLAASKSSMTEFGTLGVSQENITTKLLWVPAKDGKLVLCWQVRLLPVNTPDYWLINVDAVNNTIVSKDNLTKKDNWDEPIHRIINRTENNGRIVENATDAVKNGPSTTPSASYRVIPYPATNIEETAGKTSLVMNPWEVSGATNPSGTLGWHNDGSVNHDSTRGNNVWAREDTAHNNGNPKPGAAARSTTTSPSLTFDFPFDSLASPLTSNNQKFAITQLFYWNNIMHDISYQYGFDEVSGNFQNSNLNRGGVGNDYVIADAQDGGGTNNANFNTPEDGRNARMQMYLWSPSPYKTLHVNSPGTLAGYRTAIESSFSPFNKIANKGPITGDLALYDPTPNANNQACSALTGTPLAGKIAVVNRGVCGFTIKVKNAQNAGAIAVIVINTDNTYLTMSGLDSSITIPAVLIAKSDGDALKAALQNGQTVNVTLQGIPLDGDLDNGIIGHEYAHGISNRLTGGPSNSSCLINGEQMGEGWSDYYALMTTTNWAAAKTTDGPKPRPIGAYVTGEDAYTGPGIRQYPYSTDTSINKWNYGRLASIPGTSTKDTSAEIHLLGEIWAATLWDMTWNIIQTDGINSNLYNAAAPGGNSIAMKLVTEGLKLQTCRPGFLDGRDAILKADTILYNAKYSCSIWRAFARRGMGVNAQQGSSDNTKDQVADYLVPAAIVKKTVNKANASENDEITYSLNAICRCAPIDNYSIIDTLPANVTYISGGTYNASNRTVSFGVPSLTAGQNQVFNLTVKINAGSYVAPQEVFNQPVPTASFPAGWEVTSAGGPGNWTISSSRSHSPSYSFKALDPDSTSADTLTTTAAYPLKGISTLSFWNYYNTEATYDGGVVEMSTDSGATWIDAGPYFTQNGYNSIIGSGSRRGFSGASGTFLQSVINLSAFAGKKVRIRFVFSSDRYSGEDGWYVDDIILRNEAGVYNIGKLYNASNQLQSSSDTTTLIVNALPITWGNFSVEKAGITGKLKWSTLQEQNTASFVVERSSDGVRFTAIGTKTANGNVSQVSTYTLTDALPLNGLNYYRIKQVDKDGKISYSEIRTLNIDINSSLITLTPNPAKDKIAMTFTGNNKTLQVTLFNTKGQKVGKFVAIGEYTVLQLPHLPSGMYYVEILGDNVLTTKKLVIK